MRPLYVYLIVLVAAYAAIGFIAVNI